MPEKNYPDVILNTPYNARILRRLFSYEARVYDLNAYEAIVPGAGQRVWDSFVREEEHLKKMDALKAELGSNYTVRVQPLRTFRIFEV